MGSYGWYRVLGHANTGQKEFGALRADVNVSHTDGWREKTAYDRLSTNLRWDYAPSSQVGWARLCAHAGSFNHTSAQYFLSQ